ncbi:MAG: hypothetical protein O3B01_11850 [Planctomycetota bacterium]|nr:hypothetical protein [Planctomycetota bacterium]
MTIDREQFMKEGYLILRDVVPPGQLGTVRGCIEHMVERRRVLSRQRRTPDQPPGGEWEASGQPRLNFATDCDAHSAGAIEFLLGETTLGVCRQLMDAEHVSPHNFACICSADNRDTGPAAWHRDISPGDPAPLRGMIANMEHHGPSYLQWNIALYEDSVLWIVPRSHLRTNTEAENRQLVENPCAPLPGGMPVELGPGDGVVYTHLLLHWGSNYTRKLRRTIHPGFRPFGFASLPNVHWRHWEPGFFDHLSPEAGRQLEEFDALFLKEMNDFAGIFRTIIERDAGEFVSRFEQLHPSPHACPVTLAMLNQVSLKLHRLKHTGTPASAVWGNGRDMERLGSHFTAEETEILRQRFAALDAHLRRPEPINNPSFQRSHSAYLANDMPEDLTVEGFIAGW